MRYEFFEYTWNHYDQLIKIEKFNSVGGDPVAILYNAYDSGGQRVVKTVDSDGTGVQDPKDTFYVTDGVELRNNQYVRYVTDGNKRIARIGLSKPYDEPPPSTRETRLVYVADHLGSATVVVMDYDDETQLGYELGCVVGTTSHLPYGGVEAETGVVACGVPSEEWYKFTGKELESSYGIYYFGARWQNPSLGNFVSVDPPGLFANGEDHRYVYVGGRVYAAVDPDGNSIFFVGETRGTVARGKDNYAKAQYLAKRATWTSKEKSEKVLSLLRTSWSPWVRGGTKKIKSVKSVFRLKGNKLVMADPKDLRFVGRGKLSAAKVRSIYTRLYKLSRSQRVVAVYLTNNRNHTMGAKGVGGTTVSKQQYATGPNKTIYRKGTTSAIYVFVNMDGPKMKSKKGRFTIGGVITHELDVHGYPEMKIGKKTLTAADYWKKVLHVPFSDGRRPVGDANKREKYYTDPFVTERNKPIR